MTETTSQPTNTPDAKPRSWQAGGPDDVLVCTIEPYATEER